jgi:hypothetical protein
VTKDEGRGRHEPMDQKASWGSGGCRASSTSQAHPAAIVRLSEHWLVTSQCCAVLSLLVLLGL